MVFLFFSVFCYEKQLGIRIFQFWMFNTERKGTENTERNPGELWIASQESSFWQDIAWIFFSTSGPEATIWIVTFGINLWIFWIPTLRHTLSIICFPWNWQHCSTAEVPILCCFRNNDHSGSSDVLNPLADGGQVFFPQTVCHTEGFLR